MEFEVKHLKEMKTYSRTAKSKQNTEDLKLEAYEPLTSKDAVRFLLDGTIRLRVCRYCLNKTSHLNELDEILTISGKDGLYEVTINDIIASFHTVKIAYDPNFPNKICKKCLDQALSCYLFMQKCEQSERAFRNYIEDIDEKLNKLDSIEPVKKRGKRKLNPNYNVLYAEQVNVIDYAEPIINLVNLNALPLRTIEENELECSKCWQVLPNKMSLVNHEKSHPKTMWYHCRICGKSFVKYLQLRRHKRLIHKRDNEIAKPDIGFTCNQCGVGNKALDQHLHHMEKHKFKNTIDNMIKRNTSDMCSICFGEGSDLTEMSESMCFHGGMPGLTGEKSIYGIVSSVFPDITLACNTGTKICKNCLNKLITTYIFMISVRNIRSRINTCISLMISNLNNIEEDKNVIIEISQDTILTRSHFEHKYIKEDMEIDVLEDEFRISLSDNESVKSVSGKSDSVQSEISSPESELENPAKKVTKTYAKKNVVNGYKIHMNSEYTNICTEFLSFKKQKKTKRICLYTCPICHKHFISDFFLNNHILKHCFRPVQCKHCAKMFKSRFYLFEHVKMMHLLKTEVYSACAVCGRHFTNIKKFKKHQKHHHVIQCQLCDKYFKSQAHHDIHLQRHAIKLGKDRSNEMLTCSFCEKACLNENDLSLHVNKTHLLMRPYSCDMCEKQFYTEYNLTRHKRLHSMLSKEECSFCRKVFKCRKNFVVHLRKHINVRPHYCPVCSQSFFSESRMKRHMKIYHGGRFCCRLCRMVVDSNTDLKNHITVAHSCI